MFGTVEAEAYVLDFLPQPWFYLADVEVGIATCVYFVRLLQMFDAIMSVICLYKLSAG